MCVSPKDILEAIPEFQNLGKRIVKRGPVIKKEYRRIYNLLNDKPVSLDEICLKTDNTVQATINLLSLMELDDLIEEKVGAGYVRKYKE